MGLIYSINKPDQNIIEPNQNINDLIINTNESIINTNEPIINNFVCVNKDLEINQCCLLDDEICSNVSNIYIIDTIKSTCIPDINLINEPIEPIEPIELIKLNEPIEPIKPNEPIKPIKSIKSIRPNELIEPRYEVFGKPNTFKSKKIKLVNKQFHH